MLVCTFKCAFHCGNQTIENTQMFSQDHFAGESVRDDML
jgi:hypothetical protein